LKQVEKYFFEGGADMAQGYVPPAEWLLHHNNLLR
jgi:Fe-S cluster biosynthesis and repair protein YggX